MRTLAAILVLAVAASAAPPADETVVRTDLGTALDAYLTRLERLGFSGTVLVAKGGQVVLAKGYGLADRERRVPMTADSVISIGSITKQFTAAAILKLEMQGKLRVEDPISKFFPGAPPDKARITLHQLLTHTAGLESDYGPGDYEVVSRDEYVKRMLAAPLRSEPGKAYYYANSGYSLLAAVVEVVSGVPYERFLRANLFEPAGMHDTGYRLPSWRDGRVARGYVDGRAWGTIAERLTAEGLPYWNLVGNGGIHSTVWDMYRWHVALEGDKVLSAEAKSKYFKPYVPEGPEGESYYAYGWAIFKTPRGTRLVAHNGGNGVFAADFRRYVDEDVVIYAASNAEVTAIQLTDVLPAVVFGRPYAMPPDVVSLDAAALDRLAGAHEIAGGGRVTVAREGGHLAVTGDAREALAVLYPAAPPDVAASRDARVAEIVGAAAKGDYKPLADAFGGRLSIADITAREGEMWGGWRERSGAFKGVTVLGTFRMRPGAGTIVRLDFERGPVFLKYAWDGPELAGIRVLDAPPAASFYPTSSTEFTSFDLRDPGRTVLRFEKDGRVTVVRSP